MLQLGLGCVLGMGSRAGQQMLSEDMARDDRPCTSCSLLSMTLSLNRQELFTV